MEAPSGFLCCQCMLKWGGEGVGYLKNTRYPYYFWFSFLQGIKAVISESFERIHRSNLVGMGIMPLEYLPGQNAESLGLTGKESYTIEVPEDLKTGQTVDVKVGDANASFVWAVFLSLHQ